MLLDWLKAKQGKMRQFFDRLCLVIFCVAIILCITLWLSDYFIGGNATRGYVENGIYFVKNANEENIAVSPILWYSNYFLSMAATVIIIPGALSLFYLWIRYVCMYIWLKKWEQ